MLFRSSADGSVGSPHVRVGHCQVPLKETRLTAGFLRLEERKIMGSEYFISLAATGIVLIKSQLPLRLSGNIEMYSDPNICCGLRFGL